jgi:hypothetical protein
MFEFYVKINSVIKSLEKGGSPPPPQATFPINENKTVTIN